MNKLYHLQNSYGEFEEYTTNERKIIMIYIDEVLQRVEQDIINDKNKNVEKMLEEIMVLCGKDIKNEIDNDTIDRLIEKLNKEHFWSISVENMI